MAAYISSVIGGSQTTTTDSTKKFGEGDRATGSSGTVWVYVQASGAITQYDWVAIDENFQAAAGTDALAGVGHMIGFAQVAFADNEWGWVAIEGSDIKVRAAPSCVADGNLWSFTTSGVLDDATSAGAIEIHGVTTITTVATNTTAVEIIARAPYATHTDL